MKKVTLCFIFACLTLVVFSQRFHIGVFGGLAAYNGDLTDKIFPKKVTNGAIGVTGNYELTNNIMLRGGYTYAVVGGADRFSDDASLRARNLAFETALSEFSVVGEYYLLISMRIEFRHTLLWVWQSIILILMPTMALRRRYFYNL